MRKKIKNLSEKLERIRERKRWLRSMGEGEINLEKKMVKRDEICGRKRKTKNKGKILSENGLKKKRNEAEIEGITMVGLERE